MKHTPGPWKISADGNDIENVYGAVVYFRYADETAEANARLMAAAPELLAACKDWIYLAFSDCMELDDPRVKASFYALCSRTRAAITAAEGTD